MAAFDRSQDPARSTRGAILDAARREVAERGYNGASLRGVARRAGVDPSLVRHYFGSKSGLLTYAVRIDVDARELAEEVLRGKPNAIGRRTAKVVLDLWDDPRTAMMSLARLSGALSDEDVARSVREDFIAAFFGALAQKVSPDRPQLRASLAASQVVGIALLRYLVADPVLAGTTQRELVRLIGRTVQRYLTEPLPEDVSGDGTSYPPG